ncbi:MAG: hypothetical protein K6T99_03000 [Armatimonadetes bacterium]|nr:hypothetical protein [Armatimonadota bacterium]
MGNGNKTISLNGRWSLAWFEEGMGEKAGAHHQGCDTKQWLEAVVPGDIHLDLMRAGKIKDPFYGLNYLDCKWTEEKEWWYRRSFFIPKAMEGCRIELQFGGLDTFATVWVNGQLVGSHRNMFVPCSFDVSDLLEYGKQNLVAVRLSSPLEAVKSKSTEGMIAAFETHERLYARKAQMSYGWDIAPRIVTTGIWRPVYLSKRGDVAIEDVCVRTALKTLEHAVVNLEITLRRNGTRAKSGTLKIIVRNWRDSSELSLPYKIAGETATVIAELPINDPKLWWPWNVGRPNLYLLSVEAIPDFGVGEKRKVVFGIRSVELIQELQEDGCHSFIFSINGQKVYAKGTNWIPGDAIFARMDRRKYRKLIDMAVAENINMFRIWGGGIYEDPYFYRLCDERGIMVWQDFMFSCAGYPHDEEFLSEVKYEAEKVVTSLRNHPSIVIWCGDNEVDATTCGQGMDITKNPINRSVLPDVCTRLDPTRPYIWSSPCSPFGDPNPMSQLEGDNHIWQHGLSYKDVVYSQDESRFVSEIGHLSIPWPESVCKFMPQESLWPPENKLWDFHFGTLEQFDPHRREALDRAIQNFGFERPESLEGYAFLTQLIQALAYKEWIEHYRRRKFSCGGLLYWNLYDNWPQFSDAVVDYYLNPKIAYYFVRRAFANLLVALQDMGDGRVGVWLINDELKERTGRLLLRCQRFSGGISWTRILPVKLPANSSRMVWDMRLPHPLMENPRTCFAQAQLLVGGRIASENFYFPAEFRDIEWPETRLSVQMGNIAKLGNRLVADFIISSALYGRLVSVRVSDVGAKLSDNFFDIPPGEKRIVRMVVNDSKTMPLAITISAANSLENIEFELQ